MKPVKLIQLLLSLLVVVTLLAGNAQAALQSVGPTDPVTTIPSWYMDMTGLALMPCNDQNGFCIMNPNFDPAPAAAPFRTPPNAPFTPITTTGPITGANFPGEGFYYSASASMPLTGEGANRDALLIYVLEFAFLGGVAPDTGVTFLRTDLTEMRNLPPLTHYRVTHPYGTFDFKTDLNGTTVSGGNAIRFEDQPGTVFNYLPPFFKSAPNTGIGPFLRMANGGFIFDVATGKKYIGDAVTAGPVTGGTNGNIFRIDRLTGPAGAPVTGASWQTPNFALMGRVFTGQIPSPMTIDRVTYARDATGAGQVDAFATALPAALLSISGATGLASTSIPQDFPKTGKFFADIPVGALPTGVSITNSLDVPPILYPVTLVDEVIISQANYNPITRSLTIKADSRDNLAPLPTLSVTAFGVTSTLDATGTVIVPLPANTIPPMTVRVVSSHLGSATAPVSVFIPPPSPLAVADTATTTAATAVTIPVLTNDTIVAPGVINTASVVISTQSLNGIAVANLDGTVTFTPAAGFTGPTTFAYTVADSSVPALVSNAAIVTVTVTPPPAPVAVANAATTTAGTAVTIPVLTNDTIIAPGVINAASVAISTQSLNGTAVANPAGTVTFTSTPGFTGTTTFAYTVANSSVPALVSNAAIVTVTVTPAAPIFTGLSIVLNGGAVATNSTAVNTTLTATSSVAAVTQMQFSKNGGAFYTALEAFAPTRTGIQLVAGQGINTILVRFKDALGNLSAPVSDGIILDTVPPTGIITVASPISTNLTTGILTLSATDINVVTQMQFSTNGGASFFPLEAFALTRTVSLALGTNTFTVRFKDAAGNLSAPIPAVTITRIP